MTWSTQHRTKYDHRIKQAIAYSGNINLFPNIKIPVSTAKDWVKKGVPEVIELSSSDHIELAKLLILKKELEKLKAENKLLKSMILIKNKVHQKMGIDISKTRNIGYDQKKDIIYILENNSLNISNNELFKFIGFTKNRFQNWKKEIKAKDLTTRLSYIQTHSQSLTESEFKKMKSLYENKKYSHYSIEALHYFAKRNNLLHCSIGTWYKYAKLYNFERTRVNFFDQFTYKIGINAKSPNELLHIDLTEIKIKNGTKYYLQAIIDNYSRYILAWAIRNNKKAINTANLIQIATNKINPKIMMDKGTENINNKVNKLINDKKLIRVIAKYDTHYSNSKIEAFFRSIKNNHLKYKYLWSKNDLIQEVDFYINEYNTRIPHSALKGLTPKEVYTGTNYEDITKNWESLKQNAQKERLLRYWAT